jgi:hypothetical protein
MLTERTG